LRISATLCLVCDDVDFDWCHRRARAAVVRAPRDIRAARTVEDRGSVRDIPLVVWGTLALRHR
jgi:hypothetical protein